MPARDDDPFDLRAKTTAQLVQWTAGWKIDTPQYLAGKRELERRDRKWPERRSWIAIGISLLALLTAVAAWLRSQP